MLHYTGLSSFSFASCVFTVSGIYYAVPPYRLAIGCSKPSDPAHKAVTVALSALYCAEIFEGLCLFPNHKDVNFENLFAEDKVLLASTCFSFLQHTHLPCCKMRCCEEVVKLGNGSSAENGTDIFEITQIKFN